jgi:hypothetical protein
MKAPSKESKMTRRLPPARSGEAGAALGAGTAATGAAAGAPDAAAVEAEGDDLAATDELMLGFLSVPTDRTEVLLTQRVVALGSIESYKSNKLLR